MGIRKDMSVSQNGIHLTHMHSIRAQQKVNSDCLGMIGLCISTSSHKLCTLLYLIAYV